MSNHQSLVSRQFGAHAAAYVTSPDHASGDDLRQIAELVATVPESRVLDLGCGGGHATFAAAPHAAHVTAYDLSPEMLDAVAAEAERRGLGNVATRQGAVERLPFAAASFDVVLSRLSAHHWSDVGAGLAEARRVLKAGGKAMFIDAVTAEDPRSDTWFQAIELLRDPSHVRDYSIAEWRQLLAKTGFSVETVTTRRLRLAFDGWIARLSTPETQAKAIRALQAQMPEDVAACLAQEADGSFTITIASMWAE
jgi:ubiquinone/menaquinone biosynthesis C-methylase UbiE